MGKSFYILICLILVSVAAILIYVNVSRRNQSDIDKPESILYDPDDEDETMQKFIPTLENIAELKTFDDLRKYLYAIEEAAYVSEDTLEIEKYLAENLSILKNSKSPQILIFHTHSQEDFVDSRPGVWEDTIVGVGRTLADILVNDYGISTVHDLGQYDVKDGKLKREGSYEVMEPAVKALLEKYPDVEVAIDLHRDGVEEGTKLVTMIDGKPTARIMFVNGVTKYNDGGVPVIRLNEMNEYLDTNLAFSLQMQLVSNTMYPGFARKIYIKPYRYSLHLLPKSLLVEVGADTSTVEEAKNAMRPLARILAQVIEADK